MQIMKKQSGIGLLELMLSLAIIAAILVLVTRYYLVTKLSQEVTTASLQIQNIVAQANRYAAIKGSYAGITNIQVLVDRGLNNTDMQNAWGGTNLASGSSDGALLTVELQNIPATACLNLQRKFESVHPVNDTNFSATCSGSVGIVNYTQVTK